MENRIATHVGYLFALNPHCFIVITTCYLLFVFFSLQTAEKALKAVLYRRNADHELKTSHDICFIACCVLDTQIRELVSKLDSVARYHTRMRYPDFLEFPKIPSDVYNESEAREACDLAQQILQRAQELVMNTSSIFLLTGK